MGVKRGKVAGYFYNTTPKIEFQNRFASKFHIDLGRFLSIEMNEENYYSFFNASEAADAVAESKGTYSNKSQLIDLLLQAKEVKDKSEINRLIDESIRLYGKILDENSQLKDANIELKSQLLALHQKATKE